MDIFTQKTFTVTLTEQWKDALDNDFRVGVILRDFCKVSDTVNHKILGKN